VAEVEGSPALGILELEHIARGVLVADAICKRTEIEILASRPISGGKHLIYLRGGVAEMEEAMEVGRDIAGTSLIDSLFLPMADEQLWPAIPDSVNAQGWTSDVILSAAVVETSTICGLLLAMDAACKGAEVVVRDVRLGMGIMGKAFFTMTGDLDDIQAAADAARAMACDRLLALEVIPAPANEIVGLLIQ
tara:strand:- start:35834 stop:36409 length:576 start_codon:yes stop_codon:yes gene_type:complete